MPHHKNDLQRLPRFGEYAFARNNNSLPRIIHIHNRDIARLAVAASSRIGIRDPATRYILGADALLGVPVRRFLCPVPTLRSGDELQSLDRDQVSLVANDL